MSEEDKLDGIILDLPPCELVQASKITDALGTDTFYSARTVAQMLLKERERRAKLAAWLNWAIECNGEGPTYFGEVAMEHMRSLLRGGDVPMPPELRA